MATKVGSVSNSNFTAPHAHRPVCFFVIARSFVTRRLSVLLRACGERGKRTGVTSEYTEKLPPPHDLPQGSGRGIVPAQSDMLEGGADVRVNLNKTQYEHNGSAFG